MIGRVPKGKGEEAGSLTLDTVEVQNEFSDDKGAVGDGQNNNANDDVFTVQNLISLLAVSATE